MKRTLMEGPRRPSSFLYHLGHSPISWMLHHKMDLSIELSLPEDLKPPYVIIANHEAIYDPLLVALALYPRRINFVGGYAHSGHVALKYILRQFGVIPKFQYQLDLKAMRDMTKVIANKGILGIFPTGRMSTIGEGHPVTEALIKQIKKWNVPVIGVQIEGTYFIKPKWAVSERYGPVHIHVFTLFDQEQIKAQSMETMLATVNQLTHYNEYTKQMLQPKSFKGERLAEHLENILYRCPQCQQEFKMASLNSKFYCRHCQSEWYLNDKGMFEDNPNFKHPQEWFLSQRDLLASQCEKPTFLLQSYAKVIVTNLNDFEARPYDEGSIRFDASGIEFKGKEHLLTIPLKNLESLPFKAGENFEIAIENEIFKFELIPGGEVVKWSMAVEIFAEIRKKKLLEIKGNKVAK